MERINLLERDISEKIAAGEVVERPSSVVKELVENAIDAGCHSIQIFVNKAGKESIRVIDDGSGIHPQDIELAFSRHATSKVRTVEDLNCLSTLGFRGEALASIAAVSKIEIKTRQPGSKEGTRAILEEGKIIDVGSTGCPVGTDINVKDLFYNTPARFKFMRKDSSEVASIHDMSNKFALANPDIKFELVHNQNKLLKTPGRGELLEVLANIYGYQTAKKLVPVDYQAQNIKVRGYVSKPELTRSNRNYQTFFVNGRYVKSTMMADKMEKSYHTLLPRGRYPFAVLKLQIPESELDVNVHPAKIHVRFNNQKLIGDIISKAVSASLNSHDLFFNSTGKNLTTNRDNNEETTQFKFKTEKYYKSFEGSNGIDNSYISQSEIKKPRDNHVSESQIQYDHHHSDEDYSQNTNITANTKENEVITGQDESNDPIEISEVVEEEEYNLLSELINAKIVGQVFASYWILESGNEVILIDQHAAHERVNYQILMDRYLNSDMKSQQVIPFTIELDSAGLSALESNEEHLNKCGLEFDLFGQNTLLIRSVPFAIKDIFDKQAIYDLIDQILEYPHDEVDVNSLEEMLITVACKKSIKANQSITAAELKSLLESLSVTPNPYTCPHGRPILVRLSKTDLERLFYRS